MCLGHLTYRAHGALTQRPHGATKLVLSWVVLHRYDALHTEYCVATSYTATGAATCGRAFVQKTDELESSKHMNITIRVSVTSAHACAGTGFDLQVTESKTYM